ncbi:hypothetical protein Cgig2_018079 [Carnegiea gigantea]|uniref:Uncharacterized protein n=1 Tax=Carnegiea gigantea TaxID=171969 RepID=A0A9Q1JY25_9CARY|nr:hypothetical protein Cgig2_018079 [Carnegiea gigantea]
MDGVISYGRIGKKNKDEGQDRSGVGLGTPLANAHVEGELLQYLAMFMGAYKKRITMFCIDAWEIDALLPLCLTRHRESRVFRSSYHNVVRANEIQRYIDIIRHPDINNKQCKDCVLNERHNQGQARESPKHLLKICCVSLDSSDFCLWPQGQSRHQNEMITRKTVWVPGSESDESSTPKKIQKMMLSTTI